MADERWTSETLYAHFTALRQADQHAIKVALDASNYRTAALITAGMFVIALVGLAFDLMHGAK